MTYKAKLVLVGLAGVLAGAALTVNLSAIANKDADTALPVEELRAFADVFARIKSDYVEPVEDKKLINEAINGMLTGLDPHSAYLDAEGFKDLQVGTQGEFGGLGIEVGMEDGLVKVISPIEDTPAFRAGVKPGDLIVKLDDTPVKGMTLNDAVKRMRGKPGSVIRLTIARKGVDKPIVLSLTRAVIKIRSVKSTMLDPGYGYVRVTQFQEHTGELLVEALNKLYKESKTPLKGLVLDLRNDPGGLLNGAVAVTAAFVKPDSLVAPDGQPRALPAADAARLPEEPAGGREGRADGGARQQRLGLGVRDRCGRAAGPQAGGHHGDAHLRQGVRADHPAARQWHGHQAHHGALLHPERSLDPGQGHRAGHRRRGSGDA